MEEIDGKVKEEIIRRIVKLMALGDKDRNPNSEEAQRASDKVAELMMKYSLNFEQLRDGKPVEDVFATIIVDGTSEVKVDYESQLALYIAHAFDCKPINTYRNGPWQIAFCGTKHDLEIAVYFFKFLQRTVSAMARLKYPKDKNKARRNYCLGLVKTIGERLEEIYKKKEEMIPADCRALVLRKKDGLEDYFREQFPSVRKGKSLRISGDIGAFYQGEKDGKKVQLSRPISEQSSEKIGLAG